MRTLKNAGWIVAVLAAVVLGATAGWALRASVPPSPMRAPLDATGAAGSSDVAGARPPSGAGADGGSGAATAMPPHHSGVVVETESVTWPDAGLPAAPPACEAHVRVATERADALAREILAMRADRAEREGEPIEVPAGTPARLGGPAVRAAITAALRQTRVVGQLEELACDEYPCIAFGRLQGDEEEIEEIERSAALLPYRDDVLTLLFWAVTDETAPRDAPRETGLFALAFYARDDGVRLGERLDRRIRTRAVDLWATMRPGWRE